MNRETIILTIKDINDIKRLKNSNIKYINIDILNIDTETLNYLKENGQNYLYAESINDRNGYIYVDYETFIKGEKIINNIISNMPKKLSKIEIAKYIYISIGKLIGYDINTIPEKNETFNFNLINRINNIWGCLTKLKATNQSYCKLYLYLCSLLDIKCDIITINNKGFLCNKLTIDDNSLIVDLTSDIPFIEANFKTRHFSNYNNELELDININYIKDNYNELKIEKNIKSIDCNDENYFFDFLIYVQQIIKIDEIHPIELGIIFDILFQKYCPDSNISINNLYINNLYNKQHFILITYNDSYYSYNYNKQTFMKINKNELINNIEKEKIGIYENENIPIIYKNKEVV